MMVEDLLPLRSFLPAAKPSRSRRGVSSSPHKKIRINRPKELNLMLLLKIEHTKFSSDMKLDPLSCSGTSRGAVTASSLWRKAAIG